MSEPTVPAQGAARVSVHHQRVGWFELFYDLVIVAAVGYAGHTFAEHPTWALGLWIAAWTLIMYVLWLLTALNNNLFPGDRPWRRVLGLVQMLALVVAALGTVSDEGLPNSNGFVALAAAFGTIAVMYAVAARDQESDRRDERLLGWTSAAAALVLLTGLFLPDDAEWTVTGAPTWIITIGVAIVAVPLFGIAVGRVAGRIDDEHLGERLGQLVIIVLGEAFVSLVTAVGGLSSIPNPLFFVLTFLVVFAIWTLYFSTVLPAGLPKSSGRLRWWVFTHWLLMFGAVGAAAGFASVTLVPFGTSGANQESEWTTLPLAFVMFSLTVLTWLGAGVFSRLTRLHAIATGALLLLAAVGILFTPEGENWEIVLGSLVVMVDAVVVVRLVRPYSGAGVEVS
jgi:low temperature requirement protein LtrA